MRRLTIAVPKHKDDNPALGYNKVYEEPKLTKKEKNLIGKAKIKAANESATQAKKQLALAQRALAQIAAAEEGSGTKRKRSDSDSAPTPPIPSPSSTFKCVYCGNEFSKRNLLAEHYTQSHIKS